VAFSAVASCLIVRNRSKAGSHQPVWSCSRLLGRTSLVLEVFQLRKSLNCEARQLPIAGYGDAAADKPTNGRAGGKQPLGNLARRSPAFSLSAASRKAARKRP